MEAKLKKKLEDKIEELSEEDRRLGINFNRDNDIAQAKFEAKRNAIIEQRYYLNTLLED